MRLPNTRHEAHSWRIRGIVPDFTLEDAWAMPIRGGADEFPRVVELLTAGDLTNAESLPTRLL